MRSSSLVLVGLTLAIATFSAELARASGTYAGRPPRRGEVDAVRYHLGKDLFLGKIDPVALQRKVLERLEAKLPEEARKEAHLEGLAGNLSAAELAALVHYVAVTYGLEDLDEERYALGQAVFQGRGDLAEEPGPTARLQADRLSALEDELPAEAKPAGPLTALAGRLTYEQLEALEFYCAVHFRSEEIARRRFRMGQRIFRGERREGSGEDAGVGEEAERLKKLEKELPESAQTKVELASLAGKLTPAQLDALEYYLVVRYKLR